MCRAVSTCAINVFMESGQIQRRYEGFAAAVGRRIRRSVLRLVVCQFQEGDSGFGLRGGDVPLLSRALVLGDRGGFRTIDHVIAVTIVGRLFRRLLHVFLLGAASRLPAW